MERISRDQLFLEVSRLVGRRSACLRSQVGAVIVKDGRIISIGYNGPVSGAPQCEPRPSHLEPYTVEAWKEYRDAHPNMCEGPGCTRSLHAETNAIAFAARAGMAVEGCTLYCTMSPCVNCAKVIINSGIRKVVFLDKYRDTTGIELLERAGVEVSYMGNCYPFV